MTFSEYFTRNGFILREAGTTDVIPMMALINHAFAYQDATKGDVRIDEDSIRHKMESSTFYVIYDMSDNLAGCLYLKPLTVTLYFGLLGIADDYRGTGLAHAVMAAIETYARELSMTKLRLDYMSLAPWLESYYERYGFVRSGIIRDIGWTRLIRMEKMLEKS